MKPQRDSKYLAFIRSLPCVVCGRRYTEAAHTGPHGLGQKASDRDAIPLCEGHHRTRPDSYHALGRRRFEERHDLDIREIIAHLNVKPRITIVAGWYLAAFDDHEYTLGRVESLPLKRAIKTALSLRGAA